MVIMENATGFENRMNQELYNNRFVSDDSDNRITSANRVREPLDQRAAIVKQPAMGTDGAFALPSRMREQYLKQIKRGGGLDKGQNDNGFFARWREYRTMLKEEYPWVRGKKLGKVITLPFHYVMYKAFDYVSQNTTNRQDSITKTLIGGFSDTMGLMHKTQYKAIPFEVFPRLNVMTVFANGATDIEKLYTYVKNGFDIPIHTQLQDGSTPKDDDLIQAGKFVEEYGISTYNKIEDIAQNMIDSQFVNRAMNKVTRGDFKRYFAEEPKRTYRWVCKDEMGAIYAIGDRDTQAEANLPAQLAGKVKIFKEPGKKSGFWYRLGQMLGDETPSSWKIWWYWTVRDTAYDVGDILFGPAEGTFRRLGFPTPALRNLTDAQYKVSAAVTRNLTGGSKYNTFSFEPPGMDRTMIDAASRHARDIGYS